jgi:Ca2+-binding RTX toxin-like protein
VQRARKQVIMHGSGTTKTPQDVHLVKRRLSLVTVTGTLLVLAFAGVALALNTITCDGSSICRGMENADDITGTERAESILALKGRDAVTALEGPDIVHADVGNDEADGGSGKDRIFGEDGDDQKGNSEAGLGTGLDGNSGADHVSGGPGADDVTGGPGRDSLYGNDDNDILDSADGLRDNAVSCGPGRDVAFVDRPDIRGDRVRNCEEVRRISAASLTAEQYRAADAELR